MLGVREMRIKARVMRLLAATALTVTMAGGAVVFTASPALAAPTYCKTLEVSGYAWQVINPRMSVPICHNGGSVWQNGRITPGVTTVGYYVAGFDWYGSYGGGTSFGVGENFFAHLYSNRCLALLRASLDDQHLGPGDELQPELLTGARGI